MARRTEPRSAKSSLQHLHLWQFQAIRDLLLVAAAAGLVWLGYALRAVTVPLLVALLLAYLFEPLVARASRHPKLSRPVVVGGLLTTVGVVVIGSLAVLIPVMVAQTAGLVRDYQGGGFRNKAIALSEYLPEAWQPRADVLIEYLPEAVSPETPAPPSGTPESRRGGFVTGGTPAAREDRIRAIVREEIERSGAAREAGSQRWLGVAKGGARAAVAVIGGIVELGFVAFLIPFYFFFFSVWYPTVVGFGRNLIPDSNRERALDLLAKMDGVVAGFVRGRIVISLVMGVMFAIGWKICGVPYSSVLGLVTGLFCAVPYLGIVGLPVAVSLLAFRELAAPEGQAMAWWLIILGPSLVYGIVQTIEGYVLIPMIAGKATNLDPVTILVAVLAGGSIMGVYGMLLAIPVAACIKILCTEVLLPKVRAWTSGEAADPLPIERE